MKQTLYFTFLSAILFLQCKKDSNIPAKPAEGTQIEILSLSVPGIDPKNIMISDDLIVIHLPENYAGGDYIKPDIIFGAGYSSQSPVVNGFAYEGKEVKLLLENVQKGAREYTIVVVPQKAIELTSPAKNLQLTIGPETLIKTAFKLKGTQATVDEEGELVNHPLLRMTDQQTGEIAIEFPADISNATSGDDYTFLLPSMTSPGRYRAEIVWGAKTALLSPQVTVKAGPVKFKRGSWHMLQGNHYFNVFGYNFSPTGKHEALVENDFIEPQRIQLRYENAGVLSGNLPDNITSGNYRITYFLDGKEEEPYQERSWLNRYSGDDHFYIRSSITQPIARLVTQHSHRSTFDTHLGYKLDYYPSVTEVDRREPILVFSETTGPTPDRQELILVHSETRKEYILPNLQTVYILFDGFLAFLAYDIKADVPNGKYELYVVRGTEKTERYSRIITIK